MIFKSPLDAPRRTSVAQSGKMPIVAHRGTQFRLRTKSDFLPAHNQIVLHTENTIASFKDAFKRGYYAELDVTSNGADFFERNGQAVTYRDVAIPYLPIFHDNKMDNPFAASDGTPSGSIVRDTATKTIQTAKFQREPFINRVMIYLGKEPEFNPNHPKSLVHLDESPEATRIPTLDEVFNLLQNYPDGHLFVEIKTLTHYEEEDTKGLELKVLRLIQLFGVAHQVTVISFNQFALEKVIKIAKELNIEGLRIGWDVFPKLYLKPEKIDESLEWAKENVNAILIAHEEVSEEMIRLAHDHGLLIMSWPYWDNRETEINLAPKFRRMGLDGMITNVPSDIEEALSM